MSSAPQSFLVHNGILRPVGEALLTCQDGLVSIGRGAFETLAAYRGRPFLPEPHFDRLREASQLLGLRPPDDKTLLAAMAETLRANDLAAAAPARLRVTLSSPADDTFSWWVEATPVPAHPTRAKVVTGPFIRNERSPLAGLKTTNAAESFLAMHEASRRGGDEALFANTRGELCEGTWSNIFVKVAGRWLTPPLSSGCLPGITRALVLELFREIGSAADEATLSIDALDRVDSAFLTSSLRELQPIASIDGRPLVEAEELESLRGVYRQRIEVP